MGEKRIGIASDHAGYGLKETLKEYLTAQGVKVEDFGAHSADAADYPDYAHPLAQAIDSGRLSWGIAICGSGQGVCMTVNKYPGVRAALVWDQEGAQLTRQHNDANILCLPARTLEGGQAEKIVEVFFSSAFEGGRHARRVNKIPPAQT